MPDTSIHLWEFPLFLAVAGFLLGTLVHIGTLLFGSTSHPKIRFFATILFFILTVPALYRHEISLQPLCEGGTPCSDTNFCVIESNEGLIPFSFPLPSSIFLPRFCIHLFFLTIAVFVSLIDLEFYVIPDLIMVPATVIAVLFMTFFPNGALPDCDIDIRTGLILVHPLEAFRGNNNNSFRLLVSFLCIFFWVFALLDRRWYPQLGLKRAFLLFFRRLSESRLTIILSVIGLAGIIGTWCLYRHTPFPNQESMKNGLLSALVGTTVSMILVWGVRIIGRSVLGREAMGFGDVILIGFLGAIFGWQGGLILFFMAPLAGILFGIIHLCFHSEREIPFGPFLTLAGLGLIFFWEEVHYYVHDFLIGPLVAAILILMGILMAVLLWVIQILKRLWA